MVGSWKSGEASPFTSPKKNMSGGTVLKLASVTGVVAMSFALFFLMSSTTQSSSDAALFDDNGRYVMRNYDDIKPSSNFLAGLGGLWGIPMVSHHKKFFHIRHHYGHLSQC